MDKLDQFEPDELNIKELIKKVKSLCSYITNGYRLLLYFACCGFVLGVLYSLFDKPDYKAVSTFVLEESNRGGGMGLSQYSGLASMAGIDLGSGSDKGLFQGDNILELYKSRRMIEKTLLTKVNLYGKNQMLIDKFIEIQNKKGFWFLKSKSNDLSFENKDRKFNRKQDSVIRDITKYIDKYILTVTKPDKKLSIIDVEVKFSDEGFAQTFNQTLVQNVNEFYVQTQTRKTFQNVHILQHQADSVRSILNNFIGKVAESTDVNPYPNPTLHSLQVPFQKKQIDVQANTAIYGEIVKNLELSKISLRQETPLIQIIDEPILPLENDKTGLIKGAFIGTCLGLFFSVLYLLGLKLYIFIKNA